MLLDDAYGRIRQVLLTLPGFAVDDIEEPVRSVLAGFPEYVRFDILTSAEAKGRVAAWVEGRAEAHIHAAPEGLDFTHWARDALVAVETGAGPRVLISEKFGRRDDAAAARALAEAAGVEVRETHIALDGGNLLAQGGDVLVGRELFEAGADSLDAGSARRVIALGTATARPAETVVDSQILPTGWRERRRTGVGKGQVQPLFHIDLFVSPAGKTPEGRPRWLVGCPRLGARHLGLEMPDHADAELFDEVAANLADTGAEVIRNPQPLIWTDWPDKRLRTWHHFPVNNVIVEIEAKAQPRVWLPHFACEAWQELARIDAANRAIWEGLGFGVTPVTGCLALAERRGALRCMLNVVARGSAGS